MFKVEITSRQLCLASAALVLAACTMGNSTFESQPIHHHTTNTTSSSKNVGSEHLSSTTGSITAISHEGMILGRISILSRENSAKFTIISPKGKIIADAFVSGNEIVLHHGHQDRSHKESFSAWSRKHFGIDVSIQEVLSWLDGHPYNEREITSLDTDDPKRKCFLEDEWLVCIQQPEENQKTIKRTVQVSTSGVNISVALEN